MKTLRYWLGLPLFNLILGVVCWLYWFDDGIFSPAAYDFFDGFVHWMLGYGVLIFPFLTALYYPVGRKDCRPLWKTAILSFFAIMFVCAAGMVIGIAKEEAIQPYSFVAVVVIALQIGFILALVETAFYALGLLVARIVWKRKNSGSAAAAEEEQGEAELPLDGGELLP